MTLEELKERYQFYFTTTKAQIEQAKYHKGFGYNPGNMEETQAENEAVLKLIEEKEKRLN